jgi:hypothetical protein
VTNESLPLEALIDHLRWLGREGDAPDRTPRFPNRPDRPPPTLDPERARREAQIGFQLGLARAAALIHEAGGGHF